MIKPMKPKHRRAVERQRINFRVFRDFRGSSFSLTILLSFALLLAAAPAPAQSPAILLDIKSPATTSPPNESLLTLDEEGNLWIKGQLYDRPFQSTITLDPNRDYWTIRDASGNVVWALEAYNRTTSVSAGDLYSIGFLRSWSSNPNQPNALARYFNSSGQVVFSVDAGGNAESAGITPVPEPAKVRWDLMSPSLAGKIVPEPFPQGRIYCRYRLGENDYPLSDLDVTGIEWRKRYDPSKGNCSLIDYGLCWGFRFWWGDNHIPDEFIQYTMCGYNYQTGTWGSWTPCSGEPDAYLILDANGKPKPDYEHGAPCFDSTWTVSAFPTVPGDRAKPIPIPLIMVDQPPAAPDPPMQGNFIDSVGAVADSLLYLYDVEFPANLRPLPAAIPRKSGDASVTVGCNLRPQDTPGFSYMELILWDPAQLDGYGLPFLMKIISSSSPSISQTWNGKLYPYGDENSLDYEYTQASDIFMSAVVYWNTSNPPKPWETGPDTFHEPRYAIVVEAGGWGPVSADPYNFAWITSTPAIPSLSASIVTNGDAVPPELTYWSLRIQYNRTDRSDDDTYYSGTLNRSYWQQSEIASVLNGAFRGGKATMTCLFLGTSVEHVFHIRGLSADPTTTVNYINANNTDSAQFSHWYALKIARQESSLYHFEPATAQHPLPGPNEGTDLVGQPRWHEDLDSQGNPMSYGWGLFQITNPRPESQHLWNWQQNEAKGIDILRTKRASAVSWVDDQRAQMHTYRSGQTPPLPDLPIPAQPYGSETFGDGQSHPPEDACTIQAYKGATYWVLYWDIDGHQWQWRTDGNAAYVINVCNQ